MSVANIPNCVIWQYWETRGRKPAFIDGLRRIAERNSGCQVTLVTPSNLSDFLPDIPADLHRITTMAHKADMIRAMLVARHGGMWLDSDALVLSDLTWIFELLKDYDFIGFNNQGQLGPARPWVRVNCFAARRRSVVVEEWVRRQHAKFPRVNYEWEEIGTEILHPVCLTNTDKVKMLPFEDICPVPWDRVEDFLSPDITDDGRAYVVMLSNASLGRRLPILRRMSCADIAKGDGLLASMMRRAIRGKPVDRHTSWLSRIVPDRIAALASIS